MSERPGASAAVDYRQKRIAVERRELKDWERRAKFRIDWRLKRGLYSLGEACLKAAFVFRRGQRNAAAPVVTRLELEFEGLPAAFDGFEILHLSDFHGNSVPGLGENLAREVGALAVDLCVLTGDYRLDFDSPCEQAYAALRPVLEAVRARHGVAAVLGNVDSIEMVEPLERMGVRMLVNERWRLERGGESITVLGVDDPHDFGCDDLAGALRGAPEGEYRILLVHSPEIIPEAVSHGVSLYLCGHTHGGQVCLPLIGTLRRNANCERRFTSGVWRQDGMSGFTTRGVGVTGIPVRFGCPPEIAVIRLRRANTERF